jgi:creatinine amidohydrolase
MCWYRPDSSAVSVSEPAVSWPDVPARALLLVPAGSFEQHGPHLPLHTDTTIATAVASAAARRLPSSLVAPPLAFGSSGEHQDFPGTLSVGTLALQTLIIELVRSASRWAGRTVFVNGHGGNLTALRHAVPQLRREGHDAGWVPCAVPGADAHAGQLETSVMLFLAGDEVRMERAVAGNVSPLPLLMPALVTGGVRSVSPTGVLGDPRGATASSGAAALAAMVDDVVARVHSGLIGTDGLCGAPSGLLGAPS